MSDAVVGMVRDHETILRGEANDPGGLVQRMDRVEQVVKFQTKLAWILIVAIVGSVVHGEWRRTESASASQVQQTGKP